MAEETSLSSWPRLARAEDLILWAGQLIDRIRTMPQGTGGGGTGPPGPTGPTGPPGPTGGVYRYVQATASTTWSITHGLTFRPNVTAVDSTGREILPGDVSYPNDTTVTLTFSAGVAGEAYLS